MAGLRSGDKIVAVDGQPVHNWKQIGNAIKEHPAGSSVPFTIDRGSREITKQVTLASVKWRKGAFLGVSPIVVYNRNNPIKGVSYAGSQFGSIAAQSVTALGRIPKAIPYLFSKDRAPRRAARSAACSALPTSPATLSRPTSDGSRRSLSCC